MVKHTFINHKIWAPNHGTKLQNLVMLFITILVWLWSVTVFALNIESNFSNTVQTIARIIISTDWTAELWNRIYDINYNSWMIKAYLNNISPNMSRSWEWASGNDRRFLWIDMAQQSDSWHNLIFIEKDYFTQILSWISLSWAQWPAWPQWNTWLQWLQWLQWNTGSQWNTWLQWLQWLQWNTGSQWNTWLQWSQWLQWNTWPQWNTWLQWLQWLQWNTWPQWNTWDTWPVWPQWNTWIWIGDDLWNHTALTNLIIWSHYISNDWNPNVWIWFDTTNNLLIKWNTLANWKIRTYKTIKIADNFWINFCDVSNAWEIRFKNNCFQWCDWLNRIDLWWAWCGIWRDFAKRQ